MTELAQIYQVDNGTFKKQYAQRPSDKQWFYRTTNERGFYKRWIPCEHKSEHAWYNPQAGKARLPPISK